MHKIVPCSIMSRNMRDTFQVQVFKPLHVVFALILCALVRNPLRPRRRRPTTILCWPRIAPVGRQWFSNPQPLISPTARHSLVGLLASLGSKSFKGPGTWGKSFFANDQVLIEYQESLGKSYQTIPSDAIALCSSRASTALRWRRGNVWSCRFLHMSGWIR